MGVSPISHTEGCCSNCTAPLRPEDRYCTQCGQSTKVSRLTVKQLFGELIATAFNIDSQFFRTLRKLWIPGFLTREFFRGRHVSYLRPLRLFFITMLLMYTILGVRYFSKIGSAAGFDELSRQYHAGKQGLAAIEDLRKTPPFDSLTPSQQMLIDSLSKRIDSMGGMSSHLSVEFEDNRDSTVKVSLADVYDLEIDSIYSKYRISGVFNKLMVSQVIRARKEPVNAIQSFIANTTWMLLLLMPALACFMKLLYIRRNHYLIEHLIFLFHYHTTVFVGIILFLLLLPWLPSGSLGIFAVLCVGFLYAAMKSYYRQGWTKTAVKLILLGMIYAFVLLFFLLITALVSFALY